MSPSSWRIDVGDCRDVLRAMPARSVHTCVCSPPYFGLRDYGTGEWEGGDPACDHLGKPFRTKSKLNENWGAGFSDVKNTEDREPMGQNCSKCGARRVDRQIGLEPDPDEFVAALVEVFRGVRRVLRDDGTVFLNLGDSYASAGQSRPPHRAPAYGSDDTAPQGSPATGSACHDLCDGCRAATQNHHGRNADTLQPPALAERLPSPTDRDTAPSGSGPALPGVSPPDVPASTTQRSSEQPRAECSHCSNCGVCLAVLRSSARDARLCAHTAGRTNGTGQPVSESRIQGTDALGTAWLNYKAKDLLGIPWAVAFALRADGWYLRSEIILAKKNPMPESVRDRPTRAHEQFFLLTKRPTYFYDSDAVREPAEYGRRDWAGGADEVLGSVTGARSNGAAGDVRAATTGGRTVSGGDPLAGRNRRSVWWVTSEPFAGAHFATFGTKWIEPCILAGAPERACGECGAPWVRVVEREASYDHTTTADGKSKAGPYAAQTGNGEGTHDVRHGVLTTVRTLGFEPSCSHYDHRYRAENPQARSSRKRAQRDRSGDWWQRTRARRTNPAWPTVPGVVLDPFAGAGTTGMVALRHNRSFVGVELNPEYAAMARTRIETAVRLGFRSPQNGPVQIPGQASIFDLDGNAA